MAEADHDVSHVGDPYSALANRQLDEIEATDPDLYDALIQACEFVLDHPLRATAASQSVAVTKPKETILRRFAVVGRSPWKIFWDPAGPRIEAVFEYPTS